MLENSGEIKVVTDNFSENHDNLESKISKTAKRKGYFISNEDIEKYDLTNSISKKRINRNCYFTFENSKKEIVFKFEFEPRFFYEYNYYQIINHKNIKHIIFYPDSYLLKNNKSSIYVGVRK